MRPLAILMLSVLVACSRDPGAGGEPPSASAAPSAPAPVVASASASPASPLPGSPDGGHPSLTSPMAQALGIQFAAKRWPQYHARMATAFHGQDYWKVVIEFNEPGVGGNVILDMQGNMIDGGTSTGQH